MKNILTRVFHVSFHYHYYYYRYHSCYHCFVAVAAFAEKSYFFVDQTVAVSLDSAFAAVVLFHFVFAAVHSSVQDLRLGARGHRDRTDQSR